MSPDDRMQLIGAVSDAIEARSKEVLGHIERLMPPGQARDEAQLAVIAALLEEAGQVARRLEVPYDTLLAGAVESWSEIYGVRSTLTVREPGAPGGQPS